MIYWAKTGKGRVTKDEHTGTMLRPCNSIFVMDILFGPETAWTLFSKNVSDHDGNDYFLCFDGYPFNYCDSSHGTDSADFSGIHL